MVNEGRLAPVVDVVQALREEPIAGTGNNAKGGAGGKGVGDAEDAGKCGSGGNRGSAKKDVSGRDR